MTQIIYYALVNYYDHSNKLLQFSRVFIHTFSEVVYSFLPFYTN